MNSYEPQPDRARMAEAFWHAPKDALFTQKIIAAALELTEAWCEHSRWNGEGPSFIKLGRSVRYRKADVVAWIDSQPCGQSTAGAEQSRTGKQGGMVDGT